MRYKIFSALLAVVLTFIFFRNVGPNEFFFLHDEFLFLSPHEASLSFYARNPNDLGVANTTLLIITFFDRLYYESTTKIGLDIQHAQKVLYFLKIFFLVELAYFGLKKLHNIFAQGDSGKYANALIYLVSLWYSFNTYTLIYFNGNGFSLTLLVCYALAPLALYYFHKSVFEKKSLMDKVKFCLLLFLMSFALPLFLAFTFILSAYTLFYIVINKQSLIFTIRSLISIAILFLPFLSVLFLIPYEMYLSKTQTINLSGGETYNLLNGGFLYQYFMWFSWGLYTYWEPRNIFTYYAHYQSLISLVAPFFIYLAIIFGFYKKGLNKKTAVLTLVLLILFLFVKGAQEPFGELYLYMLENVPFFKAFRSPDSKFGFGIVLMLAVLLVSLMNKIGYKVMSLVLILILVIQNVPLLTGEVITGKNTASSFDRIIHLGEEQKELISFLNTLENYGYVLPLPSTSFGHFKIDDHEQHIGQDLLPKFSKTPFIHINEYSGMLSTTYNDLSEVVNEGNLEILGQFPIKYILVRRDLTFETVDEQLEGKIRNNNNFKLAFENNYYSLYENSVMQPLVSAGDSEISFVSPTKIFVSIKNLQENRELVFRQNHNSEWKIFPESSIVTTNALAYFTEKPLFADTHKLTDEFGNKWVISKSEIVNNLSSAQYSLNQDGSIDINLTLYYGTQYILLLGLLIVSFYFIILVMLIFVESRGKIKSK